MISPVVVFRLNAVMMACVLDCDSVHRVSLDELVAREDVWNWLASSDDGMSLYRESAAVLALLFAFSWASIEMSSLVPFVTT